MADPRLNQDLIVIMEVRECPDSVHPSPEHRFSRYRSAKDLIHAAEVCRDFIARHNLSNENWDGGYVFAGSRQIAYIEYGGTVLNEGDKGYFRYF